MPIYLSTYLKSKLLLLILNIDTRLSITYKLSCIFLTLKQVLLWVGVYLEAYAKHKSNLKAKLAVYEIELLL